MLRCVPPGAASALTRAVARALNYATDREKQAIQRIKPARRNGGSRRPEPAESRAGSQLWLVAFVVWRAFFQRRAGARSLTGLVSRKKKSWVGSRVGKGRVVVVVCCCYCCCYSCSRSVDVVDAVAVVVV